MPLLPNIDNSSSATYELMYYYVLYCSYMFINVNFIILYHYYAENVKKENSENIKKPYAVRKNL
jgi:hypothetical protein